jgi:prevent-host-death family protein
MTIVMEQLITKSQFKPQALMYLRMVQQKKQPLIITHGGMPVIKIIPYSPETPDALHKLKGTVIFFDQPMEPIAATSWEAAK